jgi:hypothetical protein
MLPWLLQLPMPQFAGFHLPNRVIGPYEGAQNTPWQLSPSRTQHVHPVGYVRYGHIMNIGLPLLHQGFYK